MADLTPEALTRAERTILAAPVFAEQADLIAARTPDLADGHVLVAIVDDELAFAGTHVVARAQLVVVVPGLEGDGWAMVFSHRSDAGQVRHRAGEMASLAGKRIEMIRRLRARQN